MGESDFFRLLVDFAADYAVFGLDAVGRVSRWNRSAERLFGYANAAIVGQPVECLFAAEDTLGGFPQRERQQAIVEGRGESERWQIRQDGSRFWATVVLVPLFDKGVLSGFARMVRDRSDALRAEAARLASEVRQTAVLQTALDAIITIDHVGRILEFNPAAERTFGHSRAEALGRDIGTLIVPARLRQAHQRGLAHYLATGEGPVLGKRIELPALRADGSEFPAELAIVRVPITGPPLFTAYLRDIGERSRIERNRNTRLAVNAVLAEAATVDEAVPGVLRAVCESLGWDVGLYWALDGDALCCLESWFSQEVPAAGFEASSRGHRFGPGQGLPGRVWATRRPAWILDAAQATNFPRAAVAASEGLHAAFACPVVVGPEILGVLEFFSRQIREPDADLLEMMGTFGAQVGQFVQRRRAEEALRETDRRKDEFLATLAHELRNPLAPIRNALALMKSPRLDAEGLTYSRQVIERQVHHLVRLVDDLLDVSRVMRGKIVLRRERISLAEVVARAVEAARPLIDAQGHCLTVSLAAEPLPLDVDPVRLAQVTANLLTNAAKYTDRGGRIELSGHRDGNEVVLSIVDNGIGLDAALLPRIFDLFVQADHTAARSQGGLGIGLTLVKNLVEAHGGSVAAHSDGLGRGSAFVVRLPLAGTAAAGSPTERPTKATAPARRILLVDDNRDAADSLAVLLRLKGHEVRVEHNGAAALAAMQQGYTPHFAILDIGMPDIDGHELARRLRSDPAWSGIALVALTGWGQAEDHRLSKEAGFDHHLVKPVEPERLDRVLNGEEKGST